MILDGTPEIKHCCKGHDGHSWWNWNLDHGLDNSIMSGSNFLKLLSVLQLHKWMSLFLVKALIKSAAESNLQHILKWFRKKKLHDYLFFFPLCILYTLCGSQQTEKFLKRWEYQTTLPASWENYMQVKNQLLELDMEQQTGLKLRKEYFKAVCCHPEYSTSMQRNYVKCWAGWSTSWIQDFYEKFQ